MNSRLADIGTDAGDYHPVGKDHADNQFISPENKHELPHHNDLHQGGYKAQHKNLSNGDVYAGWLVHDVRIGSGIKLTQIEQQRK